MSRGTAMIHHENRAAGAGRGSRLRPRCLVMSGTGLAVQLMTMSASASSLSRSVKPHRVRLEFARPALCARARVRLAITMRLTPGAHEMPRRQRIHFAGADHQRGVRAQIRDTRAAPG